MGLGLGLGFRVWGFWGFGIGFSRLGFGGSGCWVQSLAEPNFDVALQPGSALPSRAQQQRCGPVDQNDPRIFPRFRVQGYGFSA